MTTAAKVRDNLEVFEVKPGHTFKVSMLKTALPDKKTALFFAKLYKLDARQLSALLYKLWGEDDVIAALTAEGGQHSSELQDYIADTLNCQYMIDDGQVEIIDAPPPATVLPELWEQAELVIADSIAKVAETLGNVVGMMPGKQGEMVFQSMMTMNAKRPTIGDFKARIHHQHQSRNLVILDVSGSMSRPTVETIIDDVVALSWKAEACLVIVSNTTTFWNPGEFSSKSVLEASQFGGTHYETLEEVLNQDWGVVVTIADYDSSASARDHIRAVCTGTIEKVLDISLVGRPTFLAECVGQLAKEVEPLLISDGRSLC
jgi:hypothetical protein